MKNIPHIAAGAMAGIAVASIVVFPFTKEDFCLAVIAIYYNWRVWAQGRG